MMKVYEGREFRSYYNQNSGRVFSDLEFRKCRFISCAISITRDPRRRSTVQNAKFIDCEQIGCALDAAIVEDVIVDGFKTHGGFNTWAAVFKHVVLKGRIGPIMINPLVATGMATPQQQRAFDEANASYYSAVDWALDITEAEFEGEADIRRVPARLIRRDPETQVVVRRDKALQGAWRTLGLSGTYWPTALEFSLERGDPDVVLVAPKRHQRFRQYLDGLKALRDAGVAEPD